MEGFLSSAFNFAKVANAYMFWQADALYVAHKPQGVCNLCRRPVRSPPAARPARTRALTGAASARVGEAAVLARPHIQGGPRACAAVFTRVTPPTTATTTTQRALFQTLPCRRHASRHVDTRPRCN